MEINEMMLRISISKSMISNENIFVFTHEIIILIQLTHSDIKKSIKTN